MKNKYIIILFIVIGIFISSLITIYALNIIQPGKTIEAIAIPIAFLNIFATGYGAYLGAKISGENATKLMKEQLIITELIQNSKKDYLFLSDFDNIVQEEFIFDLNNSNRLDVLYNYSTVYKSLKEIGYEDVSAIIKFPFDEFFSYFTNVIQHVDDLEYKLNSNLNSFAKNQLDLTILDSTKLFGYITFKIMYKNSKNNNVFKIPYTIIDANDRIEYKYLELDKNNYLNEVLDLYNREFEELLIMIQKLNDKYYNLQFKSKEDLKQYIFNFYSSVN